MRFALAGNPNSGKTTMFNALTGSNEKVGNWAGVTVDKKEHSIKKSLTNGADIVAVDLPGAYSMSPFTSEESVTSDYVKNDNPDVIINIVDATNLSRSLFFTTQLMELGIPVVVALNKADINRKRKTEIDVEALSFMLGCPVIKTSSVSAEGVAEVVEAAISKVGTHQSAPYKDEVADLSDRKAVRKSDRRRFHFVNQVVKSVETRKVFTKDLNINDRIDKVLTNRWLGIPFFALVMFLVFYISQSALGPRLADFLVGFIDRFQVYIGTISANAHPLLRAILVDGIIGGVGAVVGFLPLVMVMYFCISLLEDCGYMARVSVVLDPIFKKVGLSGKSVIPFVMATGCAVPGVMACRTIRNERERRAAAMLAPFMPCGAKLPVIALFAGVFFAESSWVGTLMYFAGIAIIFVGALIVNGVTGNNKKKSYFIIELPEYKIPSVKRAFLSMCSRGKEYLIKAGTVILICNTVVQLMQSFNWKFQLIEEGMESTSILATVASPIAVLLVPLGFGVWQMAAAAFTGFIAKENVVGTIAVCYGITNFIDTEELALTGGAGQVAAVFGITKAAALACLVFNLFTPPCFAAIGAMISEIKSGKWMLAGISLQLATGYITAFLVYQVGTFITEGTVGKAFVPGLIAVAVMVAIITFLVVKPKKAEESKKVTITVE
jgi:ferrous iron transport protein B